MAGSMNRVTLLGNVGKAPELRSLSNGDQVANLSLATSESWTDKATGEKKERTEWHRVVCWNPGLCTVIERYVSKGSKILVEGKLQTRKWTGDDGADRYSTEVVLDRFGSTLILLGDGKREDGEASRQMRSAPQTSARPGSMSDHWKPPPKEDLDDEIPF